MNLIDKKFKNSNFSFLLSGSKGNYAIYHSLTCEIIYGGKNLKDLYTFFNSYNSYKYFYKMNNKLFNALSKKGFIVENDRKDKKIFSSLKSKTRQKSYIKTLYLSLTYKCNLKCSYCISNNSVALNAEQKVSALDMTEEIARLAADFYLRNVKVEGDKEVVFYGGEPILNLKILKFLVNYINEKEKIRIHKNKKYKKSRYILCTNGTLINREVALYLKENNIYPAVTFDGDKTTHDRVRKYANQGGSYRDVLKAYRILQKLNFPIGVTLTLGSHNITKLPEYVKFFSRNLKPYTMATNIMIDYEGGGNKYVCDGRALSFGLIESFKVARKEGLYLVKYVMDNRVKPFVEKMPRLKGCTGTGSRAMILPDGTVSACMAFAKKSAVILQPETSKEDFLPAGINNFSPFLKNECNSCFAIACCGGGCPKNALNKHGTFSSLDDDYCLQSKNFLEWLIWDLFNFLDKSKLGTDEFLIPGIDERRKVYGKIKVSSSPLDFQYTPKSAQK
jgi:uncharacterized protein